MSNFESKQYLKLAGFTVIYKHSMSPLNIRTYIQTVMLYHLPQPTPLHKAAMKGNLEIVKYLVDHGANVNSSDHNGVC